MTPVLVIRFYSSPPPLATTTAALCSAVAHSDQTPTHRLLLPSQSLPCAEATHRPGSELQRPPAGCGSSSNAGSQTEVSIDHSGSVRQFFFPATDPGRLCGSILDLSKKIGSCNADLRRQRARAARPRRRRPRAAGRASRGPPSRPMALRRRRRAPPTGPLVRRTSRRRATAAHPRSSPASARRLQRYESLLIRHQCRLILLGAVWGVVGM